MAPKAEHDALHEKNGMSKQEKDWSQVSFWFSHRFLTVFITFWGFACMYLERINLSIAIVCMVKKGLPDNATDAMNGMNVSTNGFGENGTMSYSVVDSTLASLTTTMKTLVAGDEGYCESIGLSSTVDSTGEFTWSKELQGLLLGSFFWGYLVLQVPGGVLSERFGATRVVFFTMFPVAILNLVTPVSARASPWLFLVVRVLIGVGESSLYPAAQALMARWAPPSERSRMVSISLSGGQFGNAIIFPLGGILCSELGWDSVFYVTGAIGFVWCILWYIFVYDSPSQSKYISDLEREYILHHVTFKHGKKPITPWKSIFTSLPFWTILIAHSCGNYGLYMMLTQIPTYMKEVLKFDLKSNGAFSMMPYLLMWMCITLAGILADMLITKNIMRRLWVRKLMTSIGCFCPALCLIGIGFMDCTQQVLAVVLLCGSVGLSGFAFAGYLVNHADIAPQYAGTLFGITNVAATIPGIIAPYLVAAITTNKTRAEWQIAFFVAAAIYTFGGLFYVIFGSTTVVKWAAPRHALEKELEIPDQHESKRMLGQDGGVQENNV